MKYVCYKKTVSKVVDEEIKDIDGIKSLLAALFQNEITCSMRLKSGQFFDKTRITKMDDDMFHYVIFNSNAKLKKQSQYDDIVYLEITTVDNILSGLKPEIDRWNLLDAEDIDES